MCVGGTVVPHYYPVRNWVDAASYVQDLLVIMGRAWRSAFLKKAVHLYCTCNEAVHVYRSDTELTHLCGAAQCTCTVCRS
jgi:hypothetical protein